MNKTSYLEDILEIRAIAQQHYNIVHKFQKVPNTYKK
jgi:hypothetical protein